MPTLLRLYGLRFFFWSREHKPIHVHVESSGGIAKFELESGVKLIENLGLTVKELKTATQIITENQELFTTKWMEYHG
jgi:hypothetical protein